VAQVVPFRGMYFDTTKVGDLSRVVTPPYDVIRPDERENFAAMHPNNMVHLILPPALPGDSPLENRYTRAAALFRQWQQDGVFRRDDQSAYYYWETRFNHDGRNYTRRGLAALVHLEPFDRGIILPHEQTFSKIKADRLELFKNCQAHFSPIYALFPDPENQILDELAKGAPRDPLLSCNDVEGREQLVYRVTDPEVQAAVYRALEPLQLFIADGHHRYETAMAFQKWMKERYPLTSPKAPFNYMFMYLANLYDPELVILMAHRMLRGPRLKNLEVGKVVASLERYFDVTPITLPGGEPPVVARFLQEQLAANNPEDTTFIMVGFGFKGWRLKLKEGMRQKILAREMHPALAALDVAVLNYLVLGKGLGLDSKALDDQDTCKYSSKLEEVVKLLAAKEVELAFILNPTQIEQVRQVAMSSLVMPRKSTYFYPKVMTGLLLNTILPGEEVVVPGEK
jgi:uncharacterized protein (DUF1015 family)